MRVGRVHSTSVTSAPSYPICGCEPCDRCTAVARCLLVRLLVPRLENRDEFTGVPYHIARHQSLTPVM